MLDILGRVTSLAAEEPAVEPEISGLLLSQGAVMIAASHRGPYLAEICTAQVVTLAASTDSYKGLAAVLFTDA
jgi:hypothetical protein